MASMLRRGSNHFLMVAGLVALLVSSLFPVQILQGASSATGSSPASLGKRWVAFGLESLDASGELPVGKPVTLSISVGGVARSQAPLVAICESVLFERQVVTLELDSESSALKGTATLEPIPTGKLSVTPKVARVQVTFVRLNKDKFDRVMTRIVYITLGASQPDGEEPAPSVPGRDEALNGDAASDEVQPDVEPMATGHVVEEDLLPLPSPDRGRAYWQQVSLLVSRSWSRAARRVRHAPSSETVRVRFRLYPSGRAQLIQIEKGSGAREIDEAGIFAVVHAQPFPPFPEDVGTEPVDVHVRMRTGPRLGSQDAQAVANPQQPNAGSGTITPKK